MCYNIAFLQKRLANYIKRYEPLLPQDLPSSKLVEKDMPVYYFVSGFEHPVLPVIANDGLHFSQWGLIPHWVKDENKIPEIMKMTLNAKSETAFEKPSFRKALNSQRCLLGIDGFYEWKTINKKKYPYYIYPSNQYLFSLGCLYDVFIQPKGKIIHSFSILTTAANPMMEDIHNTKKRMPLIISRDDEKNWVKPDIVTEEIKQMMRPFPESGMQAHPVSTHLNSPIGNRNTPDAMNPINHSLLF
ncbi:SOS response-associated peptidase [Natronoflexus pectinivorans]|uniref:Abasic site processing protein n=1 Tax=Natronoflexus pectinivorans TaxID=682526 RepID=A0A4R2GHJ4_9BACT|nr:SOS response-associated peptidase [Natronoflexus pectinivorans]TCO07895.1 putative SOS response-associated peptidase YedK [Natronoflexus pectinivorans]